MAQIMVDQRRWSLQQQQYAGSNKLTFDFSWIFDGSKFHDDCVARSLRRMIIHELNRMGLKVERCVVHWDGIFFPLDGKLEDLFVSLYRMIPPSPSIRFNVRLV